MLREIGLVVASLSLFTVGCGGDAPASKDAAGVLEEAFGHEHFQATYQLLESRGDIPEVSAARVTPGEGGGLVLSIPVRGSRVTELRFQTRGDASPEVSVKEAIVDEDVNAAAVCGTYLSANSCSYGPWDSGQKCANGATLYKYDKYTRRYYSNGRKISYETTWYDCNWMAQPTDCNSTCT